MIALNARAALQLAQGVQMNPLAWPKKKNLFIKFLIFNFFCFDP